MLRRPRFGARPANAHYRRPAPSEGRHLCTLGRRTHRPKCRRVFQCHLLQNAQRGAVTVDSAPQQIAGAREQIRQLRATLGRLGNRDEGLPIGERCAETLAAEGGTTPETDRADLEVAMVALENTLWNTFFGSGQRRGLES